MKIISQATKLLKNQDYSPRKNIEGVRLVEIKRFSGEDGAFNEIVRLKEGKIVVPKELASFSVKQINHSFVFPGTVKAWHLHYKQDEIWFIHPEAVLLVGLLDVRQGSKSKGEKNRYCFGQGKAHLLLIPRGVAHGLANPYLKPASMTYLVNNHFNGEDEKRLPPDFGVKKDFWAIKKG
ncbi:dTDP-4-dehydrorhamnose 3,5-epimerase family protein [Patescibacteria group bacterium]